MSLALKQAGHTLCSWNPAFSIQKYSTQIENGALLDNRFGLKTHAYPVGFGRVRSVFRSNLPGRVGWCESLESVEQFRSWSFLLGIRMMANPFGVFMGILFL
jgi:hypothetical protein